MKKTFGSRVKLLRGKKTQNDFAKEMEVKQSTLSSWERGRKEPTLEKLLKINSTYGVSIDWLLGISDDRRGMLIYKTDPVMIEKITELEAEISRLTTEVAELKGENSGLRFAFGSLGKKS